MGSVEDRLAGAWELVSFTMSVRDGGVVEPYGRQPRGSLVFLPAERLASVHIACRERAVIPKDRWLEPTAPEAEGIVRSYFAYWGHYVIDAVEGTIAMDVRAGLHPNLAGTRQIRRYSFEGDDLVLAADAPAIVLTWRRPARS